MSTQSRYSIITNKLRRLFEVFHEKIEVGEKLPIIRKDTNQLVSLSYNRSQTRKILLGALRVGWVKMQIFLKTYGSTVKYSLLIYIFSNFFWQIMTYSTWHEMSQTMAIWVSKGLAWLDLKFKNKNKICQKMQKTEIPVFPL